MSMSVAIEHSDCSTEKQGFPSAIEDVVLHSGGSDNDKPDRLLHAMWSELEVATLCKPFRLPPSNGVHADLGSFVLSEMYMQCESMRSRIDDMLRRVSLLPRPATAERKADRHVKFVYYSSSGGNLNLDMHSITKEPSNMRLTNSIVAFQTSRGDFMDNICLGYCTKFAKAGVQFLLGKDHESLSDLTPGTTVFCRPLVSCTMWKTHIKAMESLNDMEAELSHSQLLKQVLAGKIESTILPARLDQWIGSEPDSVGPVNLSDFNKQQQRALALEALTDEGIVCLQGPPGTGKSHTICEGLLPQCVHRNERVLVLCNSNVAIDALMLKAYNANPTLRSKMKRCGFKDKVNDEIIALGLYNEGDAMSALDRYGRRAGENSNTNDEAVQSQIRNSSMVFTTIHFATKEKAAAGAEGSYWTFDTLILDEAAQVEDSKVVAALARAPSLRKLVLVGDPKQIQPYTSDALRELNYGRSTMERVMGNSLPYVFVMLQRQFRMPPMLRSVISHLYYQNRLEDDDCVKSNGPTGDVDLLPLLFIDIKGSEMKYNSRYNSYENVAEASVVQIVYEFLYGSDFQQCLPLTNLGKEDVCILTPYNRHKDVLQARICEIDEDVLEAYTARTTYSSKTTQSPKMSPTKAQTLFAREDVTPEMAKVIENIDTVDKFQGSERPVVIISTCVDRRPQRAKDPHFINVACSRAKHLLIIVGTYDALSSCPDWRYVKQQAEEHGSVIEHRVEVKEGFETTYKINESDLLDKLKRLTLPPRKRVKS